MRRVNGASPFLFIFCNLDSDILVYKMNYKHIISIINTAIINKNSEQLYFNKQHVYLEIRYLFMFSTIGATIKILRKTFKIVIYVISIC